MCRLRAGREEEEEGAEVSGGLVRSRVSSSSLTSPDSTECNQVSLFQSKSVDMAAKQEAELCVYLLIASKSSKSSPYLTGFVYRIALKFRRSLISRISRIWNDSQKYFNENFYTSAYIDSRVHRLTVYRFGTSRAWMDSIRGPSYQIHKERSLNTCLVRDICGKQRSAVLQLSAAGAKVRGAYLKMSAKKAELRNWKASSRAWSTSHNSLLRLSLLSFL